MLGLRWAFGACLLGGCGLVIDYDPSDDAGLVLDGGVGADSGSGECIATGPEQCNGVDDDCNDVVDDGFPMESCGIGACATTSASCADGMVVECTPLPAGTEACNAIDDDCDGSIDEQLDVVTCGAGVCMTTVTDACVDGVPMTCTPGPAGIEICDGVDNDCNDVVDDGCTCARYVVQGGVGDGTTALTPIGTIQAAIASLEAAGETGEVCVAARSAGPARCVPTVYAENVVMSEGIDVLGQFDPATWRRDPICVTVIESNMAFGVTFPHGLTNETRLDGFTVQSTFSTSATAAAASITVQAGGTLSNLIVVGPSSLDTVGVRFAGVMGAAASPELLLSDVTGGSGALSSTGVRVENVSPRITQSRISGGRAEASSIGVEVRSGPGAQIVMNEVVQGGSSDDSFGVRLEGDLTGVTVTDNTLIQGQSTFDSTGIGAVRCSTTGAATISRNRLIVGGRATTSQGVHASGACDLVITENGIAGAGGSPGGSTVESAFGVRCEGSGTTCDVRDNTSIVGLDASGSGERGRAVVLEMTASGRVQGNELVQGCAGVGSECVGIEIVDAPSSPSVERNVVAPNRSSSWSNGIRIHNSQSVVANNEVTLDVGQGIVLSLGRALGSAREPLVHSNTVVALPSANGSLGSGLLMVEVEGDFTSLPPFGIFRNNVAVCLTSASTSGMIGFAEFGRFADPRVVENNDIFGCGVFYRDDIPVVDHSGPSQMQTAAGTQGTSASNNLAISPPFVAPGTDHHLDPTSALIDAGSSSGTIPPNDFDLDARPQGAAPDIGFDEVR